MKLELQGNVFKNHNRFKVLTSNQEQTYEDCSCLSRNGITASKNTDLSKC